MEELLPTYLLQNAYSCLERKNYLYTQNEGMGHSTKTGQHSSAAHTKARKAKRRMSKKH